MAGKAVSYVIPEDGLMPNAVMEDPEHGPGRLSCSIEDYLPKWFMKAFGKFLYPKRYAPEPTPPPKHTGKPFPTYLLDLKSKDQLADALRYLERELS